MLFLVIERKTEKVAKCGKRPLHGVGLGLFQRALMRFAERGSATVADAASFAADDRLASAHPDPYPCGVGAHSWLALRLGPDALGPRRLAIPAIKAEDSVGLGNDMPAFDIGERAPPQLAGPHVLAVELAGKALDLWLRESHHRVLTEMVALPLLRTAPGTLRPPRSAAVSPSRSSFARCGFQECFRI